MLGLFSFLGSVLQSGSGVGSLVIGASALFNGSLGRNNAEKTRQLQIHHHQEIAQREQARTQLQARIEYTRIMCQKIQHQEGLLFQKEQRDLDRHSQAELAELGREFQGELAQLNREFQAQENVLNRDLQLTLVELNQEFQTQQGEIGRAFVEKIEIFKADLQKYFFDRQRELQIELKAQDIDLARELRQYDRQTAISVVREQKRQNQSPIWLVAEDLLSRGNTTGILPLNVFFSPPVLKYDRSKESSDTKGFPQIEQYLQEELRRLFQKYQTRGRPIDYLAGAWTSKQFSSEAAARQIFLGLKSEPTLILESTLEGENLSISFAYWGLGYLKERYQTLMSFSWLEALYDFVKGRTETWFQNRLAEGTSEAEWIADYGEDFVRKYQANRAMMERERRWIDRGEDIRELARNYHIAPRDWDELKRFVAVCHCAIAGWIADEYFLLGVSPDFRQSPLLPELLPELLSAMSEAIERQFVDASTVIYQGLYQGLIGEIPDWEPELQLELATSLTKLPDRQAARDRVNVALTAWLSQRGIDWQTPTPVVPLLAAVATPEDEEYLLALHQVWRVLGITTEVEMGSAYYRRGEDCLRRRDYAAAIAAFDRAIDLGYAEAKPGRELVRQFQSDLADRSPHPPDAPAAAGNPPPAVAVENLQLAALNRQLAAEQQQRALLEAKLQEQANLFAQTQQRWEAAELFKTAQAEADNREGKLFSFEIVRVDRSGEIVSREQKQARCLTENLPLGASLDRVYIPGGKFLMGSPVGEGYDAEKPQHQVTVAPFFMSKYPITQAQWRAVASLPQIHRSLKSAPSNFKGDNRPVERVAWYDAIEFCARLSQLTGREYRLPSEAEWEYACRGGTTTPFYFGETITPKLANYNGSHTYGDAAKGEYRKETTNVGIFPPNNFGLYDLHGNVWEWCADTWHENYVGAPTDASDWIANGKDLPSLLRGGAWYVVPDDCRSASRYYNYRDPIYFNIGFRVVCTT